MKVAGLLCVWSSLFALTMNLSAEGESLSEGVVQSQQFEAAPVLEEPIAIIEALESAIETEPNDAVAASPESALSEEGCSEAVASELVESSDVEAQAVPAAEKSSSVQGGKGHAKDPRINSDRPRVTHREAPEQKSGETQVVQEELNQDNSSVSEDQAVGLEGNQQVIQVPEDTGQNQVVQEEVAPKAQVQQKPRSVQPKAAQKVKPQAKPKSPSGTSTPRPLNRNSVYQEAPVQEKTQAEEEADSKVLSLKGLPNRVMIISREKRSGLNPELKQTGVPLETKKGRQQREHSVASTKQPRKLPTRTQATAHRKQPVDRMGHLTQSHATVYQDCPVTKN